jgi:putative sigma-54 modulation protein
MQLAIRSHGFPLTEALRAHVERRIRFALSHATARIRSVTVVLSDINGPRGGRDKACRVRVAIKDNPVMVIDDTETNLYSAIDRAADRAGRTLSRILGRMVKRSRRPPAAIAQAEESSAMTPDSRTA